MKGKLTIILIAGISLVGCTTMRPIDARQSDLIEQLDVGDHLVIYEKSGRIVDMTLALVDGDSLEGTLVGESLTPVQVGIDNIEKIEVEKIDGAKTTLAVVGGVIIIVPLALLAAMSGAMFSGY
jgi:hypothetical protein